MTPQEGSPHTTWSGEMISLATALVALLAVPFPARAETAPCAAWKMDADTGAAAKDSSGNRNETALKGAPWLSLEESLETTKTYSVAGLMRDGQALIAARPFRAPHHTIWIRACGVGGAHGGLKIPLHGLELFATLYARNKGRSAISYALRLHRCAHGAHPGQGLEPSEVPLTSRTSGPSAAAPKVFAAISAVVLFVKIRLNL